jgi:hypothetical protein
MSWEFWQEEESQDARGRSASSNNASKKLIERKTLFAVEVFPHNTLRLRQPPPDLDETSRLTEEDYIIIDRFDPVSVTRE